MPPGIVNQAINLAVACDSGIDQLANILSLTNITVDKTYVAGLRPNGFAQERCGRLPLCFVLGADDDARTGFDKLLSATLANAAAASGDNHDLVRIDQTWHLNLRLSGPVSVTS